MLNKLKNSYDLIKNMGWRYVSFRIVHELKVRSGLFKKNFPIAPEMKIFISLEEWKKRDDFFINRKKSLVEPASTKLHNEVQDIVAGKIAFFDAEVFDLGADYDWVTNPESGYRYDRNCHWTKVSDYDPKKGDIKYVWEKSRFSYLGTVMRYDAHSGEDHSAFVWNEISSWMKGNPINAGPNYKCSQEISLRIFNWIFALNFYKDATTLTETFFQDVMHYIYWQLKHVYENINFSRIAVRNNHALTETLGLYISGMLFPFFPGSSRWKKKGKKWFEDEVAYQVYEDGTFLQFSMNYHRVVIQLFNFAFAVSKKNGEKFSPVVYERAYQSLNFLYQSMEMSNGWLPNYGSNDGALFFKFSDSGYRDYRPQLNCLHLFLTDKELPGAVNNSIVQEEAQWMGASQIPGISFASVKQTNGWHNFESGGYYLLREETGLTFIRCGNHKDRPAQADNLHIDIWYKGENILYDAGSYKYNTSPDLLNYFMGTSSHNTVMLDENNQMLKGARFIWNYWSQADYAETSENENEYIFDGRIKAYYFIDKKIRHRRMLVKNKYRPEWKIVDEIMSKPAGMTMRQLFHIKNDLLKITVENAHSEIEIREMHGYRSDFYGAKEETVYYSVESKGSTIETILTAR